MKAILVGITLAVRAIARNGLRASLTVLGILIGVASVITVTALGAGARDGVTGQIQAIGSNVMIIFPQSSTASGVKGAQGSGQRLTEEDGKVIQREAVSVAAVCPNLRTRGQIVNGDKNASTNIIGTTAPYFTIRNWKLVGGEGWTDHDEIIKSKVVLLGSTVKTKIFGGEDAVGRTVRIGRYPYRVLGVLETKGEGTFGDQDDVVVMPISSMRARVMRTPPGFAGALLASATSPETTDRAIHQIDSILRQRHHIGEDREPDFAIRSQKEFQATLSTIYNLLTMLGAIIAAISLLVGGIGVMNIMLVSVTERTREIGIRMAIGARENDIRTQFLVEAVVLAVIGGVAGSLIGIGAIAMLGPLLELPMHVDPKALTLAVFVSGMTGIVFGFMPARRASQLDPIVALRHE
jgi:putative ABC transport system permease protein